MAKKQTKNKKNLVKNSKPEVPLRKKIKKNQKQSVKQTKLNKSKATAKKDIKPKNEVKESKQTDSKNQKSNGNYNNLTAFTSGHNGIYFFNSITGELYFKVENREVEYFDRFIFHSGKVYVAGGRYDDNMAIGITIYEYDPSNNSYNKLFSDENEYVSSLKLSTSKNIIEFIGEETVYIDITSKKIIKKAGGKFDKEFLYGEDTDNRENEISVNGGDLTVKNGFLVYSEKSKKVSVDLSKVEGLTLDLKAEEYFLEILDNLLMISDTKNGISLFLIENMPTLKIKLLLSTNAEQDQTYYYHLSKL